MSDLFGHRPSIKAISLWQPWASLVAAGVKLHETRHWPTDYRGPLAIHAAKTMDVAGAPEHLCMDLFGPWWAKELPRGAMLAVARMASCRPAMTVADHLQRADLASGNFAPGRYAWRLADVRRLARPIPVTGRQGLFNWTAPDELDAILGPPLNHVAACSAIGWASHERLTA